MSLSSFYLKQDKISPEMFLKWDATCKQIKNRFDLETCFTRKPYLMKPGIWLFLLKYLMQEYLYVTYYVLRIYSSEYLENIFYKSSKINASIYAVFIPTSKAQHFLKLKHNLWSHYEGDEKWNKKKNIKF